MQMSKLQISQPDLTAFYIFPKEKTIYLPLLPPAGIIKL